MFSLLQFQDEKLFVCCTKNVRNQNGIISAKYNNRGSFSARLLATHDSKLLLESLKMNMIGNFPRIVLQNMDNKIEIQMPVNINISLNYTHDPTNEMSQNESGNDKCSDSDYMPNSTYESVSQEEAVEEEYKTSSEEEDKYDRVTEELCVPTSKACKKYYCLYCKQKVTKLARHLENVHKEEKDVQKFHDLPKGSIERKKIIGILRKKGSFLYNTSKDLNEGDMIVSRRPNSVRRGINYKACPNCRGFFSKITLRRHYVKCVAVSKRNRNVIFQSRIIEGLIHRMASDVLKNEIFSVLREDDVVRCIRYDELLILYGNKMCIKYKAKYHQKMIRARLRLLGRLLEIRSKNRNVTDFASLLSPV